MADRVNGHKQDLLNLIDIDVERNAYGRQVESRETDIPSPFLGQDPFPAVFIRAPQILSTGPGVEPLALYQDRVVLARQKNILVATFHPELTGDTRIHKVFLQMLGRKAQDLNDSRDKESAPHQETR